MRRTSRNRSLEVGKDHTFQIGYPLTSHQGSGPGGQSINKTENNVQLLHKPTGFRVACQETRSLQTNRMLARRLLTEKACIEHLYKWAYPLNFVLTGHSRP